MTIALKVTQIGNSLGVLLPKEVLSSLDVAKGDTLILSKTPNGFELVPYDPEIARQLDEGGEFMKEYRDTLRALAK